MAGGLSAVGGMMKTVGPIIGAAGQIDDINNGVDAYKTQISKANDLSTTAKSDANSAYSPYMTAGAQGATGASSLIANRQQAAQPTLSNVQASDTQSFLTPASNYSQDQARKQAVAAGAGSGAMGGGMLRALSNNAVNQASTNWNNAYQQMLDAKKTNFSQQQQQYTNNNDFQQQQIANNAGLMNTGLSAVGKNADLASLYNGRINDNLIGLGTTQANAWGKKGQIFSDAAGGIIDNAGNLVGAIAGSDGGISGIGGATGDFGASQQLGGYNGYARSTPSKTSWLPSSEIGVA
jgi:hypothetical protein